MKSQITKFFQQNTAEASDGVVKQYVVQILVMVNLNFRTVNCHFLLLTNVVTNKLGPS